MFSTKLGKTITVSGQLSAISFFVFLTSSACFPALNCGYYGETETIVKKTMKLSLLTTTALLVTAGFFAPVKAQDTQPLTTTPSVQSQASGDQVLEACSQDRADTLPNPFSDVSPDHWAFKAVMSVHYCGAYHGQIPLERVKPFLEQQTPQASSNQTLWESNVTQSPANSR